MSPLISHRRVFWALCIAAIPVAIFAWKTLLKFDADYFAAAVDRVKRELAQPLLFPVTPPRHEPMEMFP